MSERDDPAVSVITPARNMERFLRSTMRSVLAQSFTDFEYLVVDNDSEDATAAIVESIARRDNRVRLLHEPKAGSGAARNRGLREARGRYIAFVDADDEWAPGKLADQVAQLERLPDRYGGVFCRSVTMSELGEDLFVYRPPAGTYDLHSFLIWCNPAGNGSSFLVRRSAYEQAGGFDEDLVNVLDMEWLLRVMRDSASPLLQGTSQPLVRYRQRRGSISTETSARMQALEDVITRFDAAQHPLVWLRPALMAYRTGCIDHGRRWTARVEPYGWHRLVRSADGRRLLAHHLRRAALRATPGVGRGDGPAPQHVGVGAGVGVGGSSAPVELPAAAN
jgi:glycosyltransferase involved in cell wall biosynthesis